MQSLTVGTDGACSGNPGPSGWAWAAANGTWAGGAMPRSTNQAAELAGLLQAITAFADVPALTIELDSAYALNTYASWMDAHKRRGWRTGDGKPTSNRDLIAALIDARDARRAAGLPPVKLVKVKGHARPGAHPLNEAADQRAVEARLRAARGLADVVTGTWTPPGRS
ncbi:ribonuclease HI [Cellulomonas hominis]|nr:ribonuclease H [Cellulomonas hominis]NKY05609.1 ribonuclease HI [Cellulomonas hominis]